MLRDAASVTVLVSATDPAPGARPSHRGRPLRRADPRPVTNIRSLFAGSERMSLPIERARSRKPVTWLTLHRRAAAARRHRRHPRRVAVQPRRAARPDQRRHREQRRAGHDRRPARPPRPPADGGAGRRLGRARQQPDLDPLEHRRRGRRPRRRHVRRGRDDPRELLGGGDLDPSGRDARAGDDRRADGAGRPDRRQRHHRAGDAGRGIPHGRPDLAGVPRERLPRLHDARRPARRGGDRRA